MKIKISTKQTVFLLLFTLSGLSSLVLQIIWTRLLSLGVGSTSSALSIALSIFFFGLAFGSFISGKIINELKNPLKVYGIIEGIIGVVSIPICLALFRFPQILHFLGVESSISLTGTITKFIIVFLLLIIPTTGMGATLPLLVKALAQNKTPTSSSQQVALLYGINTFGAFLGCLLASFLLIPRMGIIGAASLVALINVGIYVYTWLLPSNSIDNSAVKSTEQTQSLNYPSTISLNLYQLLLLISSGIAGFASISAEIVWNKYLGIFFGTNIYGLGLNLGLFLLGIALGSFALSKVIHKVKNIPRFYAVLILSAVFFLMTASYLFNHAPKISILLSSFFNGSVSLFFSKGLTVFLIMIIPTSIFGALLPCAIAFLSEKNVSNAPRMTGYVYAINTIGAILGSLVAGHLLIPTLGSSKTILIAFSILAIPALIFAWKEFKVHLSTAVSLIIIAIGIWSKPIDFKNIVKSAYIQTTPTKEKIEDPLKVFDENYEDFKLIVEGETAIITLSHDPQDGEQKHFLRLKSNGLNESVYDPSNLDILPKYEALLGFLPHLFVRNPQNAFVVGYGGGCTADYLTQTPLKEVHVVELEEGVLQAAQYVYQNNNPIFKRRNLNLEVEDARFVLTGARDKSYDMIMSQPSHSWLSGVANLFTEDFFKIVSKKLSDKGVFSQWLNLYNLDERVLKSILKTFFTVFPHGAVFSDYGEAQMIMIGSMKPLELNLQKLELMSQNPIFRKQLYFVPFKSPHDLLSIFSLGRTDIMNLTHDARMNTDNNAYAETLQSRLFYSLNSYDQGAQDFLRIHYNSNFSDIIDIDDQKQSETVFQIQLINNLYENHKLDKFQTAIRKLETTATKSSNDTLVLIKYLLQAERYASASFFADELLENKASTKALNYRLKIMSLTGDFSKFEEIYKRHNNLTDAQSRCYKAHFDLQNDLAKSSNYGSKFCGALGLKLLGFQSLNRKQEIKSLSYLNDYLEVFPNDLETIVTIRKITPARPEKKSKNENIEISMNQEIDRLQKLSQYYKALDLAEDAEAIDQKLQRFVYHIN